MAFIEDWKDATQRDTMARTVSQGLTTATKPLSGNFGAARQPDIPAEDAAAYKRQGGGIASGMSTPSLGGGAMSTQKPAVPGIGSNLSAPGANQTAPASSIGDLGGVKTFATSQPGISKVTGGGLSSPLYTNEGDAGQAVAGLGQRMAGSGIAAPAATGTNPLSGPSAGVTVTPFGGVNAAANQQAPQNEGLARMARANAITQERIDALPRGGSAVLGGLDAMGRTRQERENDEKSARWRQDALISEAKYRPQMTGIAGAAIQGDNQQAVEGLRQKGIAAGINTQRRGQDMNYGAQMAQMGLTARAQDQSSALGNARLGLDIGRFGLEVDEAKRKAAEGNTDWRLQVTPTTRAADGTTTAGSIYRYNQRTGDVQRVDGGAQMAAPKVGEVKDGYRYNGGDPSNMNSWSRV